MCVCVCVSDRWGARLKLRALLTPAAVVTVSSSSSPLFFLFFFTYRDKAIIHPHSVRINFILALMDDIVFLSLFCFYDYPGCSPPFYSVKRNQVERDQWAYLILFFFFNFLKRIKIPHAPASFCTHRVLAVDSSGNDGWSITRTRGLFYDFKSPARPFFCFVFRGSTRCPPPPSFNVA